MTQKELAQKLNVSQNAIFNWENEKRVPSLEMVDQIAYFFNVNSSYLLGYTNIRNTLKGALDKATIIQTQDKNLEKIAILFNELNDSGQQKALNYYTSYLNIVNLFLNQQQIPQIKSGNCFRSGPRCQQN